MKTLKDLTPDILAKISGYKEKCLEGIYNGERYHNFDLEKAKKAINWNYNKCGLKNLLFIIDIFIINIKNITKVQKKTPFLVRHFS